MNLKNAIGLFFHKLFDWKTVFNPITRSLYPELYEYKGGVLKTIIMSAHSSKIVIADYESLYPSIKRKG